MNTQYKKGVLELIVLSLLYKRDRYGYDVSEYMSDRIGTADGTVYPILRKLKTEGAVTTYMSDESGGAPRKYYRLTNSGRERYLEEKTYWLWFARTVETILEGDEDDKK